MPWIWNVNSGNGVNSSRVHKKLSFEVGEKFLARAVSLDKDTNEAVLKLLDGWEFPAQIQDSADFAPNKLVNFQVEGYDNGKIILKILGSYEEKKEDSIEDALKGLGVSLEKEDISTLEKMIKHNLPLTKENVSKVKSLLDFQSKIKLDTAEEDKFLLNYLKSKGIDINSEKGKNIEKILKDFFSEFKSLNTDELLTMLENNIDLNKDNIKSFNKINKGNEVIYKDLADIDKALKEQLGESVLKNLQNENMKDAETPSVIKKELDSRIFEMKEIVNRLLEDTNSEKSEVLKKIIDSYKENSNDFKVFNSLSNEYYYLDVPINLYENKYSCKLIVKDQRKKGKKIDSTNVKFVVSLKTVNMGTVDAYIKIFNSNMNLDISCEKKWIKIIDSGKKNLEKKLREIGYNASIEVKEKKKDLTLAEYNDFFEDNNFRRIDLMV